MSSAYREAVLDDPEVAERLAQQLPHQSGQDSHPRLSEFDPHMAVLLDIYDRLGEVVAVSIQAAGGKAPKLKPAPRPVTGVERYRERAAQQRHLDLVAEVKAAQERYEQNRKEG